MIIENKLDDSGKDVTWQSLKYASYCSSLSTDQIRQIYQEYLNKNNCTEKSEDKLSEFFDDKDFEELTLNQGSRQRIIMVAGSFRKEVTSTVLWLMNYNIRIQCIKATPYSMGDSIFLNFEQILPIKEIEEFSISIAEKNRDEIVTQERSKQSFSIREEFWKRFIEEANKNNNLFANVSPSKDTWIGIGIGITGVSINLVVTRDHARTEIYINRGDKDRNKAVFDFILRDKDNIEQELGESLEWQRMDDKVTSRTKLQLNNINVFEKSDWDKIIHFLMKSSSNMETVFRKRSNSIKEFIKSNANQ